MNRKYITFLLLGALIAAGQSGVAAQEVPALISSQYHQNAPYNNACPDGCAAGCGPTAIAQILKFYNAPAHGFGEASCFHNGDTITVNLDDISFDWNNILDSYKSGQYTDSQARAIADLVYACGAAMGVKYGSSTSVINHANMLYGLQHNLHISPDSRYLHRKHYSTAEWIELLNDQLRQGHPVFYRGSYYFNPEPVGHMFVIDGLDAEGRYHVNFGHGGSGDKFADINVLNQSGEFPGGRGVCYNASQAMVINCFPTPDCDLYPLQASISEEPIILNDDLTLKEITIPLGDSFTLSCRLRNYSKEKCHIQFGWQLMKDDERLGLYGKGGYSLKRGNTFKSAVNRTITLPESLDDGDYRLLLYSNSDLDEAWKEVWQDAPVAVDIIIRDGNATVIVPDNHQLNPLLYLTGDITEVENEFADIAPGRTFALNICNPTVNNFENKVRLDIATTTGTNSFEQILPVYSQTTQEFHVLVPEERIRLTGDIESVKAYYYYPLEDRYIEIGDKDVSGIENLLTETTADGCDLSIYTISGRLVGTIAAERVGSRYAETLKSLPKGIYVVREGNRVRKIII